MVDEKKKAGRMIKSGAYGNAAIAMTCLMRQDCVPNSPILQFYFYPDG
ncbi:hypothetical protein [Maridesulfovibrio sp.]|nr:hypothetical protein [Maridesulfovibrio sp.]